MEGLQLILYLGSFDIDDILLNLISSVLGYFLWKTYMKVYKVVAISQTKGSL
ncbi:hypothetical protein ACIP9C_06420 [Lysinibacillus sp. NPDC093210]|uniref:hypothetical protein n=1 Tax=Lysinibacillus sp. NPDC093210 TaxID=3364133 RepID=UPI00380DE54B